MDPFTSPEQAAPSSRQGHGVTFAVAALIVAMVALSIVGSALWRPEPVARVTLELGNAAPVRIVPTSADRAISGVLRSVAPTVAFITLPDLRRSGSGVIVHEAGFVVTNAHVVDGGENIRVAFDDGEEYEAELYGIDVSTDLAVIKLDTDEPMPVAALGNSDALRVGEFVLALGAPFGLEATATSGIVSGLHRSGLGIARFEDFIVTDAPINRGNSGGPLVNLRGEVVGINTAIIAGDDDSPNVGMFAGVGFAIPVNVMRVVAQRLIGDGGLRVPDAAPVDGAGGVSNAVTAPRFMPRTVAFSAARAAGPARRSADPVPPAGVPTAVLQSGAGSIGYIKTSGAEGRTVGTGTGFMIVSNGERYMVTNEHVVRGAGAIRVYFGRNQHGVAAALVASNFRLDLALLKLPEGQSVTTLTVSTAEGLAVGAPVVALAARRGAHEIETADLPGQITEIPVEVPRVAPDALKAATDINTEPGDSGGPLLDERGEVVAVMVARDRDDPDDGLSARRSYAIRFRTEIELQRLLQEAEDPGFDAGFQPIWPRNGQPMILVSNVVAGGLADELGIADFDRIVSIGGQPVPVDEDGQKAMLGAFFRLAAGTEVEMVLERRGEDGESEQFTVTWVVPERPPAP